LINSQDTGSAMVEVVEADSVYEQVTVKAIMKSSRNTPISGRRADLLDSKNQVISSAMSKENGEFTLHYTIPSGTSPGLYKFYVGGEYVETKREVSIYYIDRAAEITILGELAKTTTVSQVRTFFETYGSLLGINLEEDMSHINNWDLVFRHLIGKAVSQPEEARALYHGHIALETINQAESIDEIDELLSDFDTCELLGLDKEVLDYIIVNRAMLLEQILQLGANDSIESLQADVDKIAKTVLAIEYDKKDIDIALQNKSANVGEEVVVNLDFTSYQDNISKIIYIITAENEELLKYAQPNIQLEGAVQTSVNGKTVTVELTPAKDVSKIGYVSLIAIDLIGSYDFTVSGFVEFDEGLVCPVITNINPSSFSLAISKNTNKQTSPSSTVYSSGSYTNTEMPNIESVKPVEAKYEFVDLEDVSWAVEAVSYLVEKGVVSKDDEKKFYPNDITTREQFVKMIVVALGLEDSTLKANFNDVKEGEWYYPYVAAAKANEIVQGDDMGNFGVSKSITREDMAVMIDRIISRLGLDSISEYEDFADDFEISDYAKASVYKMRTLKIVNGTGDNLFAPKENVTRAMAAKVMYEFLKVVGL
jgi:hypothetical protein